MEAEKYIKHLTQKKKNEVEKYITEKLEELEKLANPSRSYYYTYISSTFRIKRLKMQNSISICFIGSKDFKAKFGKNLVEVNEFFRDNIPLDLWHLGISEVSDLSDSYSNVQGFQLNFIN